LAQVEKKITDGHNTLGSILKQDLTAFGIAAIISAGIFSTIGKVRTQLFFLVYCHCL
jgi:hypothetical protein